MPATFKTISTVALSLMFFGCAESRGEVAKTTESHLSPHSHEYVDIADALRYISIYVRADGDGGIIFTDLDLHADINEDLSKEYLFIRSDDFSLSFARPVTLTSETDSWRYGSCNYSLLKRSQKIQSVDRRIYERIEGQCDGEDSIHIYVFEEQQGLLSFATGQNMVDEGGEYYSYWDGYALAPGQVLGFGHMGKW